MNINWIINEYKRHYSTVFKSMLFKEPILGQNSKFRNRHRGHRCFILGSGHSILSQDLTRLRNEIVITQNHFHAHKDILSISPSYHVIVPKYQPAEYDLDWKDWFIEMERNLPDSTEYFLGLNSKYLIDQLNIFSGRANYIKTGLSDMVLKDAPVDLTRPIMSVPTVLTQCLAIAIYMGFDDVYLLGMDLDQVIQLYRGDDRSNIRFYGSSQITKNTAEVKLEEKQSECGIDWLHYWMIWNQCEMLKKVGLKNGVKIHNATNGGILNVFNRCNYDDII